jgi:hypothetical protein
VGPRCRWRDNRPIIIHVTEVQREDVHRECGSTGEETTKCFVRTQTKHCGFIIPNIADGKMMANRYSQVLEFRGSI